MIDYLVCVLVSSALQDIMLHIYWIIMAPIIIPIKIYLLDYHGAYYHLDKNS
jgi:hypothetical protein